PKHAAEQKTKMAEYLYRQGFSHEELENLIDHRHVLIIRKAMLHDEKSQQVDAAKKRVATVPKIMRPGAPKAKRQSASEKLAAGHARMVKTGKEEDALAYRMAKRGR